MTRIEGKTVVVTGGSSGIGLATAEAFATRGAHVAIVARDRDRLEAAREAVEMARRDRSQRVAATSADLCDPQAAAAAFERLAGEGFVPDVLVNCAGTILPGEFEKMPLEFFERNLGSLYAAVHACRAVVPLMKARRSGHIVNVSSVAGYLAIYGYTGYSAAKYAMMGFTEALRFELKPEGVSVHVVCPPDTDTPALAYEKTLRPPETDVIAGGIKAVPPKQVAEAIVHGVERDRYFIIPDALSRFYFRLKGLLPELFFAIVDGDVAKARKQRG